MSTGDLLARLSGVRRSGNGWIARCPAHADHNASLSVAERDGRTLLHCFAGCSKEAVLKALRMEAKELFAEGSHRKTKSLVLASYDYTNERGDLLYQNVRYQPKDFRIRRPDGKDRWIWNVPADLRTIYNLPHVMNATDVLWVEGEKDAETAKTLGFTATTAGGSTSWQDRFAGYLVGKNVVIIADADEPGRKHARQIAKSLYGKAAVKVLELSGAKDLTEWTEVGGTRDNLTEIIRGTPEWKPQEFDIAELLLAIYSFVRRFVALSEAQAVVISLWVAHSHAIEGADATPYLAITSAEKQSGKTRLLETLSVLVANPWLTGRVTAAVLVRKVDDKKPTLLLDESDAAFGGEKEYAEALRGILNTGHRQGGVSSLCVGKGAEISYKDFSTFCPKAIAGIGKLPDTVADRSIPIRLKRAAPGDVMERFRLRYVKPEAQALHSRLDQWAEGAVNALREARPVLPDELSDRQQDGVEPLLAISDVAGKGWPELARAAVKELCTEARQSDDSNGIRLLADIRRVFESQSKDKIKSVELTEALADIETSPWGEWNRGKPITPTKLAKLVKPFGVEPHSVRTGDTVFKGYERADFEDSFGRYLRSNSTPSLHPYSEPLRQLHLNTDARFAAFPDRLQDPDVTDSKSEIANKDEACNRVTASPPSTGIEGKGAA